MEELSKSETRELLAYCDARDNPVAQLDEKDPLKGGEVLRAEAYEDVDGEKRLRAMVDYGTQGVKQFDASERELEVAKGKVEPTLEMLNQTQLKAVASEMGVAMEGKPSKVKMIVAIRKALQRKAEAELAAEAAEPEPSPELEAIWGAEVGARLAGEGFMTPADVINKPDREMLELPWVDEDVLAFLRNPAAHADAEPEPEGGEAPEPEGGEALTRSEVINVYGERIGQLLLGAGYSTVSQVREDSDENLLDVEGIGPKTLEDIRAAQGA